MATKENIKNIKKSFISFTSLIGNIFETKRDKAFIAASFFLSQKEMPEFSNLTKEENSQIQHFFNDFKKLEYKSSEMRIAFREAYLDSLKELDKIDVDVSPELVLLYLKLVTETLASNLNYEHTYIFNPSSNDGNLACLLAISDIIESADLLVQEERIKYKKLTESLRDLINKDYKVIDDLPSSDYRADIIVSDPFLRSVEDILIFFEDFVPYLNSNGFMVVSLMNKYVLSRVFTDNLVKHGLVPIGTIAYSKDLLDGIIDSSIVILEKKRDLNDEFFTIDMARVKNVDENIENMRHIKEYLNYYLGEKKNENYVN